MDKKLLGLVLAFFITFILFITAIVFQEPLTRAIRATEENSPSGANSLIFAWPLSEKVGDQQVRVDVFVRSKLNKPISKQVVTVTASLGQIQPASGVSDNAGKATFVLTSNTAGIATLNATIANTVPLQKTLTVKFE